MSADAFDPGLERDLRDAAARSRGTNDATPDPVFAAALRERLLTELATAPARRLGLAWVRGLAPGILASVLFVAAVFGARQLNLGQESPTITPQPTSVPVIVLPASPHPTAETATPQVTATPSVQPTPAATANPTPRPTPAPTEIPTATPKTTGPLSLLAKPCDGGVVLLWSAYDGIGFHHYATLRAGTEAMSGAVTLDGSWTTDLAATSAVDASDTATHFYRTSAFNADGGVVATSPVVSAAAKPVVALGGLTVTADAGGTRLSWSPYAGPAACFTYYKLVYSTTNPEPSYLTGDPYLAALSTQTDATFLTADLLSGQTYYLRLQAIRSTSLGRFVAAQTEVVTYLVP